MKPLNYLLFCIVFVFMFINVYGQNKPFPQALNYPNTIKPNNVTQASMNNSITAYYDNWKLDFLRKSNGMTPGGFFVYYQDTTVKYTGDTIVFKTVSEAHGYGMIIMALMTGYEDSARIFFDGFYKMYNDHRSTVDHDLMSWFISYDEDSTKDDDNATDGDMDIAYALLLAHCQWGSNGPINYLEEARRIINNGTKPSNTNHNRLMVGDWWMYVSTMDWATRSSDWMTDHLRAYYLTTGDNIWNAITDTIYSMIDYMTFHYSPVAGLLPDFVIDSIPAPAGPWFLESVYDGHYNWNACRVPWRIATDYAHYGTQDAKSKLNNMLTWLKTSTGNNPVNIKTGYLLSGDPIPDRPDTSLAYISPFITACIVDSAHQQYLNDGWNFIKNRSDYAYFGNTLNLLCMLVISGNWWAPDSTVSGVGIHGNTQINTANNFELYQNFPNPFNPTTNIRFDIPKSSFVKLIIYNSLGKEIEILVNQKLKLGSYTVDWNASDYSSGVYFYKLITDEYINVKKMLLVK